MNVNDMTADDLVLSLYLEQHREDGLQDGTQYSAQYSESNNASYVAGEGLTTVRTDDLGYVRREDPSSYEKSASDMPIDVGSSAALLHDLQRPSQFPSDFASQQAAIGLSSLAAGGGALGIANRQKQQDLQSQQPSEPSISTIQMDGEALGLGFGPGNPFKTRKIEGIGQTRGREDNAREPAPTQVDNADGQFRLDDGVYERLREELGRMRKAASASSESEEEATQKMPPHKYRDESSVSSDGNTKQVMKAKPAPKKRKASGSGSPRGVGLQNQRLRSGKKKLPGATADAKKGQMEKTSAFIERMRPKPIEKQAVAVRQNSKTRKTSAKGPQAAQRGRQAANAQPQNNSQAAEPMRSGSNARLKDLCMEDKAKIGELVKKLADETKAKQEYQHRYDEEKRQMEARMTELERQRKVFDEERESMAAKFQESLQMLQQLKESHQKLQDSNVSKDQEIKLVKERQASESRELEKNLRRDYQGGLKKFQQSYMEKFDALASQQLSQQPSQTEKTEETESVSIAPKEVAKEQNDAASQNALKALEEIGALKSEIQRLTSSLQQSNIVQAQNRVGDSEVTGDGVKKKEETQSTISGFPQNNLLGGHHGGVIHTDRASSKLSSEMQFNIHQDKQGGHINNLHRLDLTHLETMSVQKQLNELEEKGRVHDVDGQDGGRQADEEGAGVLKSFLTDGRGDKGQSQMSLDKYERIRLQAELEVRQEREDDEDDKSQDEDDGNLIDFYRNKKNEPLQDSELAPEPRAFPSSYNQFGLQRERDKQIEQIKSRFLPAKSYQPTPAQQYQPSKPSNFSQFDQLLSQPSMNAPAAHQQPLQHPSGGNYQSYHNQHSFPSQSLAHLNQGPPQQQYPPVRPAAQQQPGTTSFSSNYRNLIKQQQERMAAQRGRSRSRGAGGLGSRGASAQQQVDSDDELVFLLNGRNGPRK